MKSSLLLLWTLLFGCGAAAQPPVAPVLAAEPLALPGGAGEIGFDDLAFSPGLHRVLVPAGRTGRLDLIDPETRKVQEIGGFQASAAGAGAPMPQWCP
jgi:hypothetical protein